MKAQAHSRSDSRYRLETELFLSRLHELCGLDSPTGDVEAVDRLAGLLSCWGTQAGLEASAFETEMGVHLRMTLSGSGPGRFLLVGHHDTVWPRGAAAERPLWLDGERALAPGAADMKGGLLVGLAAMERLAKSSRTGFGAVELHSLPDEEARVGPPERLDLFAGANAALVLECGRENGAIVSSRNGATWIHLEARGRSAHAGQDRGQGRSALHAAIAELNRIEQLAKDGSGLQVTATNLVSDGPDNAVAELARVTFDLRARSAETLAWAVAQAARFGPHPGVNLTATRASGFPPMERSDGLVGQALAELERVGAPVSDEHAGGASDGCWTSSLGIPTIDGLGPIGGSDHTQEEWIDVGSVGPRIDAVAGLCGMVGGGDDRGAERDG
jgi:glutamate carboxypeptidase